MGWSEKYWEDVKSEIGEPAVDAEADGENGGSGGSESAPVCPGTVGTAVDLGREPDTGVEGASLQIQETISVTKHRV